MRIRNRAILVFGVIAASAAACTLPPPPDPPAPVRLATPKTPSEVVQAAARLLAAEGFTLTVSDAAGGVLTASRDRLRPDHHDAVACAWADGSINDNSRMVNLTISVTAGRADSSGALVQITGRAPTRDGRHMGILSAAPSDTQCASTGVVERRVAAAVK